MELAPFPCGRLPGFRRAIPSTPLDAYCYVRSSIPDKSAPNSEGSNLPPSMSTASTDPELRLESRFGLEGGTPSRRMLVIVNPYATTVSDRLKNLVVYALRGSYQVDAIDTERREHATDLCREAAREGYDVVVAFGGDGTVNEAANGLAGSQTVLTCLPGGRANVYCRITCCRWPTTGGPDRSIWDAQARGTSPSPQASDSMPAWWRRSMPTRA